MRENWSKGPALYSTCAAALLSMVCQPSLECGHVLPAVVENLSTLGGDGSVIIGITGAITITPI